MHPLKIWYKKPRTIHREVTTMSTEEVQRKVTTVTEDKLLDPLLVIPCNPQIHGAGLQTIIKECNKHSITIANLLITGLHSIKQNNQVEVSLAILCEASKLSKPTVIAAIDSLCEHHFVERVGHQTYKIEPSLAWFGNQTDWAIALKEHSEKYGRNFGYGEHHDTTL